MARSEVRASEMEQEDLASLLLLCQLIVVPPHRRNPAAERVYEEEL
jgi:hypothetical protein